MASNVLVVYYSTYGHTFRMAQAVVEGARGVEGAEVRLRRIPELEDKAAGIFTSTATIHGGQESTILTSLVPLLHLGMIFVGTPYGQNPQILVTDGVGGSPYGPGTLAGPDGSRQPAESERTTARNLGSRVARIAGRLRGLQGEAGHGRQGEAETYEG